MDQATTHHPLLEVHGISKSFPGVKALDKVDFWADGGQVTALLGENGAGKSTLMKILSGVYRADEGQIFLDGKIVQPVDPNDAKKLGIAIIYQEFNLTPNQTVTANIFLGREIVRKDAMGWFGIVDRAFMRRETEKLMQQVGAHFSPDTLVRNLSVAEQQMVEIAKALAEEARVIIMDEPTSALGEDEVKTLFDIIRSLKERGLAVIFITHRLEEVFQVADRITVLRDGKMVGSLTIEEATPDTVIAMMVGRALDRSMVRQAAQTTGDTVLEVRGLTRKGKIYDVSFSLKRGEILGVAGLVGAGRSETARAIFGADPIDSGEILIDGKPVEITSPGDALKAGLALVPENRQQHGLILRQSVMVNVALPNLDRLARNSFVRRGSMQAMVQGYVDKLNIRTPSLSQRVMNLSGGNQQKVVLAKWLASNPKVLILDEPTRGIDVGAKAEVYAIMSDLARQGIGIIMISSELPEILMMSDRILVMCEGRVTGILSRSDATQERIMALASAQVLA